MTRVTYVAGIVVFLTSSRNESIGALVAWQVIRTVLVRIRGTCEIVKSHTCKPANLLKLGDRATFREMQFHIQTPILADSVRALGPLNRFLRRNWDHPMLKEEENRTVA